MNGSRKDQVTSAFGRAAPGYDLSAHVQRRIAGLTAARVLQGAIHRNPRVLEIGCGTGFLTRPLLDGIPGGTFLVTDIAEAMVETCREGINDPRVAFGILDAEHVELPGREFDLIVSSLTMQWVQDLPGAIVALAALLAPGGRIVFSTLGPDTFAEWRAAHTELGLADGVPDFPGADDLAQLWPPAAGPAAVKERRLNETYGDAIAFARSLKTVGASTPRVGHQPLAPSAFRKLKAYLGRDFSVTYHVLFADFTRAPRT